MSDPLTGSLLILPLVLAGLWILERWVRGRDGLVVSTAGNGLQAAALGIVVLAIIGRNHLGLVANVAARDAVLMGGLVVLLVVRVAYLVRALSVAHGDNDWLRPPWPFLILPLLVYVAVLPWAALEREPDGDEPYFLLITHSLVHDFDTELTNNYAEEHSLLFSSRALEAEWADPVRPDGRAFSRHSLVLPLILAPGYAVAGKWGAMLTMAAIAAIVGWLGLYLAWRYWGADYGKEAIFAWAVLSLTPPILIYSYQIWVELPAALLVLGGLHLIQSLKSQPTKTRRQWLLLGVTLILLPLLKLRLVLLSIPLLFLAWWRSGRSRKTVVWVGLALAAALGGILLFNFLVFDKPFKDHSLAQLLSIQSRSPLDYLQGIAGLFFDCAFGLFASNPLWLLLIPALILVVKQRSEMLTDLLICVVPYLAVVSPRHEWFGAWSPPFRFGMVLLPLMALLLVPLFRRRDRAGAKGLLTALGLAAMALLVLWILVPGWTYNLATGTNHLIDHLSMALATDVGRFLPSLVRLRTASWVVPLAAIPLVVVFWWFPKRRPHSLGVWATAAMLVALATLPVAAARVPTAVVEFEDRQVIKTGGELYPGPWEPFRPRYRGGWKMLAGDSIRVPVTGSGRRVRIEIDLQRVGGSAEPAMIEAMVGSLHLGRWPLAAGRDWQTIAIDGRDWSAESELILEVQQEVVLDRARFVWE